MGILRAPRLPRWPGATAALLGVAQLIPASAWPASLLFELWVIVVSAHPLVRPGRRLEGPW